MIAKSIMKLAAISNSRATLWLVVAGMIGLRLYLSAGDEIVPQENDSYQYAKTALYYMSGTKDDILPTHRPGLPILAATVTNFGLPYKLFLDLFFVSIVCYAAYALQSLCNSRLLAWLCATFLMFSPWFINHSQVFMTEPCVSLLMLILAAAVVPWFKHAPRCWRWYWASVPAAAAVSITLFRNELWVIAGFFVVLMGGLFWYHWRDWRKMPFQQAALAWASVFSLVILPWVMIKAVEQIHLRQYGLKALSVTETPGFNALLNALYRIEPEEKIRFAPVTFESMQRACEVSPTLNAYRVRFLDVTSHNFQQAKTSLDLDGQVGTWLNWHLYWIFQDDHSPDNAMQRAADEIESALRDARLPSRAAKFPVDPQLSAWLAATPGLVATAVYHSLFPNMFYPDRQRLMSQLSRMDSNRRNWFYDALLVRRGTASENIVRIHGRLSSPESKFVRVRLRKQNNLVLELVQVVMRDKFCQFYFQFDSDLIDEGEQMNLEFITGGNRSETTRAYHVPRFVGSQWIEVELDTPEQHEAEKWQITRSEPGTRFRSNQEVVQAIIPWYFPAFGLTLLASCLIGIFHAERHAKLGKRTLVVIIVAVALVVVRCVFYALLEAWTSWGLARYVWPNHLLSVWVTVLVAFYVGSKIGLGMRVFKKFSARPDATAPSQAD
ncbi:MAG TPA: hypothetical protein PKD64_15975 [Pirellulaceae bacterium]|nr:hypothetical protein [Pirellulaceae bacterium]HMO93686.1 hypothetical protein [Pirellulaceae bacterium]HMP68428.1 hypothetical protein [Pirellulaceae bacterium]